MDNWMTLTHLPPPPFSLLATTHAHKAAHQSRRIKATPFCAFNLLKCTRTWQARCPSIPSEMALHLSDDCSKLVALFKQPEKAKKKKKNQNLKC